jgi:Tfp pilus assembly protein PilF
MQLQQEAEKALAAKDYEVAEKLLMEVLQLTPSSASAANNLGVVALHKKDLETAASWFQKASEEAPYKPDILGNFGLVRWMQRRPEESYTILKKAFSMGYESNLGNYILGTVGLKNGDSKDAVERLKKTPPERFPYRDLYLSIALRNCGKTRAADESYRNFFRHNPAPFLISLFQ